MPTSILMDAACVDSSLFRFRSKEIAAKYVDFFHEIAMSTFDGEYTSRQWFIESYGEFFPTAHNIVNLWRCLQKCTHIPCGLVVGRGHMPKQLRGRRFRQICVYNLPYALNA
uniref:Uncharacterized protein n=1 Tax=Parascaris univalens TaxID=6257 RepID=A0A915BVS5_PARUN